MAASDIFGKAAAKNETHYRATLRFKHLIVGGIPSDRSVIAGWIRSRMDLGDAAIAELVEQTVAERGVLTPDEASGKIGLARELARMNLPANVYTQWYWKIDLHNLFHFLRLRADAHAQYEIRAYAETMCAIVKDWVPLAYAAFEDYRLGGVTLSGRAVAVLKRRLAGEDVSQESSGMSKGEWREFTALWG